MAAGAGQTPHPDPNGVLDPRAWARAKATQIPAWSPATHRPGAERSDETAELVHALVLDLDDAPVHALGGVLSRFDGLVYLAHTSPGAVRCAPELTRVRVILPLASPVSGRDWPRVWSALIDRFGLRGLDCVDTTCCGAGHIYFAPVEGAHFLASPPGGRCLDASEAVTETCTPAVLAEIGSMLVKRKDPDIKAVGRALKAAGAGEMYADHPHRDTVMREMTWHLALERPRLDPESVAAAFGPSMSAPGALDDDPDEARVIALFEGAVEKIEAQRAPGGMQAPVVLDADRMREAWAPIDRCTPMTTEELAQAGVMPHEWILLHGKSCYLRGPLGYVGPFGLVDGAVAALTHLSPTPVPLYSQTTNGAVKQRSIVELCETHGRVIANACVDIAAASSRYDRETNTYYEAACPIRSAQYEPAYHAEVAEWLRRLCGGDGRAFDTLMRWLWWVTDLSKPCAALYLTGPAGTGKSLLATELGKLWSTKGPCDLEGALDAFNDAFTSCPLVFGDEFVPRGKGDEIKRLISERDRPLRRKFMPQARAVGCVRVILASNNLKFADTFGEVTRDDIDAHLERFAGIDVDASAAEYLRTVDVSAWIASGAIPRFVLWLREAASYDSQGRFLVRGESSALRRRLATGAGSRAILCEWIATFVARPRQGLAVSNGGLRIVDGRILVRAGAIRDHWELYGSARDKLRIGQINVALGAIAKKDRVGYAGARYVEIDLKIFASWCDESGLYEHDELFDALARIGVDTIGRSGHMGVAPNTAPN